MNTIAKYPDFLDVLGTIFSTDLTQDEYRGTFRECEIKCSMFQPQMKYFGVFGPKNLKIDDINDLGLHLQLQQHAVDVLNGIPDGWGRYINQSKNKQYVLYTFRVISAVVFQFLEIMETKNFNNKEFTYRIERMTITMQLWKYVNEKYRNYLLKLFEPVFDSLSLNAAIVNDDAMPKEVNELYLQSCKQAIESLKNPMIMGDKYNTLAYTLLLSVAEPLALKYENSDINLSDIIELSEIFDSLILDSSVKFMKNSRHGLSLMILKAADHILQITKNNESDNVSVNSVAESWETTTQTIASLIEKVIRIVYLSLSANEGAIQDFNMEIILELLMWILDNTTSILAFDNSIHSDKSTKDIFIFDDREPGEFEFIETFKEIDIDKPPDSIEYPMSNFEGYPIDLIQSITGILEIDLKNCKEYIKNSFDKVIDILKNPQNFTKFRPLQTSLSSRLAFCTLSIIHGLPKDFKVQLNPLIIEFLESPMFGEDLVYWAIEGEYSHFIFDIYSAAKKLLEESTELSNISNSINCVSTIAKRSPIYAYQMINLAYSLASLEGIGGSCAVYLSREAIPAMIDGERKFRALHSRNHNTLTKDIRMTFIKFFDVVLSMSTNLYNTNGIVEMVFRHLFETSIHNLALKNFEEGYSSPSFSFKQAVYRYMPKILENSLSKDIQNVTYELISIIKKYPSNDNFEALLCTNFFDVFGDYIEKSVTNKTIEENRQMLIAEGIRMTTALLGGIIMNAKKLAETKFYEKLEDSLSGCEFGKDLELALTMHIFGNESIELSVGRPIENIYAVPYILKVLKNKDYFIRILEILKGSCMHSFSNCAKLSSVGIPKLLLEVYCEGMETKEELTEEQIKSGDLFVEIIKRTIDQDTLRFIYRKMFEVETEEDGKPTFKRICNNRHPFYLILRAGKEVKLPLIPSMFSFSKKDSFLKITRIDPSDLNEFTFVISFMNDLSKEDSTATRSLLYFGDNTDTVSLELSGNNIIINNKGRVVAFQNSILIKNGEFVTAVISFKANEVSCTIKCGDRMEECKLPLSFPSFNGKVTAYVGKLMNGSAEELVLNVASISLIKGYIDGENAAMIAQMPIGEQISENTIPFVSVSPTYAVEDNFCQNNGSDSNIRVTMYGDRFSFTRSLFQMIRYVSHPCSFLILIPQILDKASAGSEDEFESKKRFFLSVLDFFETVIFRSADLRKAFFEENGFVLFNQCIRKVKTAGVFGEEYVDSMSRIWELIDSDCIEWYIQMLKNIWLSKRMIEIVNKDAKKCFIEKAIKKFQEFIERFPMDQIKKYEGEIPSIWPIMTIHQSITALDTLTDNPIEEDLIEQVTNLAASIGLLFFSKEDHDNFVHRIFEHLRDNIFTAVHTPGEFLSALGHIYEHNEESLKFIDNLTVKALAWTIREIPIFASENILIRHDYTKQLIDLLIDIGIKFKIPPAHAKLSPKSVELADIAMMTASIAFDELPELRLTDDRAIVASNILERVINRYPDEPMLVGITLPLVVQLFVSLSTIVEEGDCIAVNQWLEFITEYKYSVGLLHSKWWSFWLIHIFNCYNIIKERIDFLVNLLKLESEISQENVENSVSIFIQMLSKDYNLLRVAIKLADLEFPNLSLNEGFLRIAMSSLLIKPNEMELGKITPNVYRNVITSSILETPLLTLMTPPENSDIKESQIISVLKRCIEISTKKTPLISKIVSFCLSYYLAKQPQENTEEILNLLLSVDKKDTISGIKAVLESLSAQIPQCIEIDSSIERFPELQAAWIKNIGSFEKIYTNKSTIKDTHDAISKQLKLFGKKVRDSIDEFRSSYVNMVLLNENEYKKVVNHGMEIIKKSEQKFLEEYYKGRNAYTKFVTREVAFGGVWASDEELRWRMDARLDKYLRTTYIVQDTRYDNHGKYVKGQAPAIAGGTKRVKSQLEMQTITGKPTITLNIDNDKLNETNCQIAVMSGLIEAKCILEDDGVSIIYEESETVDGERQELATIRHFKFDDMGMVLKRQYPHLINNKIKYFDGVEIFEKNGDSIFLILNSDELCYDEIAKHVLSKRKDILVQTKPFQEFFKSLKFTQKWINGEMTNYEYLMRINIFSGRSLQASQLYPVLPFVYMNYGQRTKRLFEYHHKLQTEELRVLSRESRKALEEIGGYEHYLHQGDHSTYVMSALGANALHAFIEPFTSDHLEWQGKKVEEKGRYFRDINSLRSTENQSEMTPQMFTVPEILKNVNKYHPHEGILDEALMPDWANSAEEFMHKHMEQLESEEVSKDLPKWIDMVFGKDLVGEDAEKKQNIYGFGVFSGESQTGICLPPLFTEPHPQRRFGDPQLHGIEIECSVAVPSGIVDLSVGSGGCAVVCGDGRCRLFSSERSKLKAGKEIILEGNGSIIAADITKNVLFEWSAASNSLRRTILGLFKSQRMSGKREEFSPVISMELIEGFIVLLHSDGAVEMTSQETLESVWRRPHLGSGSSISIGVSETSNVVATLSSSASISVCDLTRGDFIISFDLGEFRGLTEFERIHIGEDPWISAVGSSGIVFFSLHGTPISVLESKRKILASCSIDTGSMRSFVAVAVEGEIDVVDCWACSKGREKLNVEDCIVMKIPIQEKIDTLGFDEKTLKIVASSQSNIYQINLGMIKAQLWL